MACEGSNRKVEQIIRKLLQQSGCKYIHGFVAILANNMEKVICIYILDARWAGLYGLIDMNKDRWIQK